MNLQYILFLICAFGLFFVFLRAAIIDWVTEYVPNNVVIGSYFFAITYILLSCFLMKDFTNLKIGLFGFAISFILPEIFSYIVFYSKYFFWKINNKGKEFPFSEEKELENNPIINKKIIKFFYIISIILILLYSYITKNINLIYYSIIAILIEFILMKFLKKYYVIKFDYAADKYKERTEEQELEDSLYFGIGGGDIILFGAIGLMFGFMGFIIVFIYATLSQVIIMIIYSIINKCNPFDYEIPFIPALASGLLIYISGMDQYLINILNTIYSLF